MKQAAELENEFDENGRNGKMEENERNSSICSLDARDESAGELRNRVFSWSADFAWSGVATEVYKPDAGSWENIIRKTLVGNKGEATAFHLRYFEIGMGGYSSLERHEHEHVVIVIRGSGTLAIKGGETQLKPFDVAYIMPGEVHQLRNPHEEPFGFFCIVDAVRDAPQIIVTEK